MYYLGMTHSEIMSLDIAELRWFMNRLQEVKTTEYEIEKAKFDATMAAMGVGAVKRQLGGVEEQ
jgi:hypothetical protein